MGRCMGCFCPFFQGEAEALHSQGVLVSQLRTPAGPDPPQVPHLLPHLTQLRGQFAERVSTPQLTQYRAESVHTCGGPDRESAEESVHQCFTL